MDFLTEIQHSFTPKRVGIEEFAESSDYCGKNLYPRQKLLLKLFFLEELTNREEDTLNYWLKGGRGGEVRMSPHIRKRIDILRDEGFPHFREVVLVGGRRCSKGFVTGVAMAKKMFDTLQLQDPGKYYGIDPEKQIYFSCLASSLDQARKFQYSDFSTTVAECHAFGHHLTKLYEREFSVATDADIRKMEAHKRKSHKIGRDISKLRGNALAANASTVRGSSTMAVVFDEMAFMEVGEETDASAEKVYDAVIPSLAQFGKDAMIFCNSSPYTKLGRFYERFEAGMALDVEDKSMPRYPFMVSMQFPSWALFEGWWDEPLYTKRSDTPKKCITQSPDWDEEQRNEDGSYFYTAEDRIGIKLARDEEAQNPDTYKVERRGQFAEIIDAYLKPELVDRMFAGRPGPAREPVPFQMNFDRPMWEHQYIGHLDPSSTTAGFGFALGHVERFPDESGEVTSHVVFDIVKRWDPKTFPNGVIEWEIVMKEVFGWIDSFRPTEITMDQYNSDAPIEWLTKELRMRNIGGVRVYKKTATSATNWNRAEVFKTALYRDLIHAPSGHSDLKYCSDELKYLQQHNTGGQYPRVDRQEIGPVQTKDMADCVMTVTEALIGNEVRGDMFAGLTAGVRTGAPGGFQIGSYEQLRQAGSNPFADLYKRSGEQKAPGVSSARGPMPSAARSGSWSSRGRRRAR
jgi:hypothetical protein